MKKLKEFPKTQAFSPKLKQILKKLNVIDKFWTDIFSSVHFFLRISKIKPNVYKNKGNFVKTQLKTTKTRYNLVKLKQILLKLKQNLSKLKQILPKLKLTGKSIS